MRFKVVNNLDATYLKSNGNYLFILTQVQKHVFDLRGEC